MSEIDKLDKVEDMVGHVLVSIENKADEELIFAFANGDRYALYHSQDCCEHVRIVDIVGDLEDLVGAPLQMAEVVTSETDPADYKPDGYGHDDCFMWTFYKFATSKGYVTIRWLGESNGYYSVEVEWGLERDSN